MTHWVRFAESRSTSLGVIKVHNPRNAILILNNMIGRVEEKGPVDGGEELNEIVIYFFYALLSRSVVVWGFVVPFSAFIVEFI